MGKRRKYLVIIFFLSVSRVFAFYFIFSALLAVLPSECAHEHAFQVSPSHATLILHFTRIRSTLACIMANLTLPSALLLCPLFGKLQAAVRPLFDLVSFSPVFEKKSLCFPLKANFFIAVLFAIHFMGHLTDADKHVNVRGFAGK